MKQPYLSAFTVLSSYRHRQLSYPSSMWRRELKCRTHTPSHAIKVCQRKPLSCSVRQAGPGVMVIDHFKITACVYLKGKDSGDCYCKLSRQHGAPTYYVCHDYICLLRHGGRLNAFNVSLYFVQVSTVHMASTAQASSYVLTWWKRWIGGE